MRARLKNDLELVKFLFFPGDKECKHPKDMQLSQTLVAD